MKVDFQKLKRYLSGGNDIKDRATIISWFNNYQAEKDLREHSHQIWDEISEEKIPENYDEEVILGKIYREIKLREGADKGSSGKIKIVINFLAKAAAVLFIPLLVLYLSKDGFNSLGSGEITYTEIYSPLGARTMFYLPDGSRGWLNGGSYIKFPEKFHGKSREVSLNGEAYFEVNANPKRPFIVSGKYLDVVATGTSFNVRDWQDAIESEVVLVEGKLDIYFDNENDTKRMASMEAGQLFYSGPQPTTGYLKKVEVDKYIAWTEGRLVFRDDPFNEVVKRLNRWYNVNIVIKDDVLKTYKYVATFEDETLDEILKMLTFSAPIRHRELKREQEEDGTFGKRTIELYFSPMGKR